MAKKVTSLLKKDKISGIPYKKPEIKFSHPTDEEIEYINEENLKSQQQFNDEIYYDDIYGHRERKKKSSLRPKRKIIKKCKCK